MATPEVGISDYDLKRVKHFLLGKALLHSAIQAAHEAFKRLHMQHQLTPPHIHTLNQQEATPSTNPNLGC